MQSEILWVDCRQLSKEASVLSSVVRNGESRVLKDFISFFSPNALINW